MHSLGFTPSRYLESHPTVYGCHFTVLRGSIPAFPSECGPCVCVLYLKLKLRWLCRQVSGDGKAQLIISSAWKVAAAELIAEGKCRQLSTIQSTTEYSHLQRGLCPLPAKAPALACCYISWSSFDRCIRIGTECSGKTISLDCAIAHFSLSR